MYEIYDKPKHICLQIGLSLNTTKTKVMVIDQSNNLRKLLVEMAVTMKSKRLAVVRNLMMKLMNIQKNSAFPKTTSQRCSKLLFSQCNVCCRDIYFENKWWISLGIFIQMRAADIVYRTWDKCNYSKTTMHPQ